MEQRDRTEGLRALIRQGLQAVSQQNTAAHLGDRSTYVGMSDIGQHWECPRAALARKVLPTSDSLERLLILQRGQWFESGVGKALASLGMHVLPQLEIIWQHQGVPIKAHLDFVLVWGAPINAIRILEVKSTDKLPDTPHDSHLLQLHGQFGLLAMAWDKPAFSLRAADGTLLRDKLTFSQLCHAQLDLQLHKQAGEVSLEAWLLCLSMKEVKTFGPYGFNQAMLDTALDRAAKLWSDLTAYRAGNVSLSQWTAPMGFTRSAPTANTPATAPNSRRAWRCHNGNLLWTSWLFSRTNAPPWMNDILVLFSPLGFQKMRNAPVFL